MHGLPGKSKDGEMSFQLWRLAYAQIVYFRSLGEFFYWFQWRFFGVEVL